MDAATGLWQTATIPQLQLVQDAVVTYGPGDPMNRWYTNVGGAVEFITLNACLTAPFKHIDIIFNALNILNQQYNEYLWVSAGDYFSTPAGGYELAYPAAPFTCYGGGRFHF